MSVEDLMALAVGTHVVGNIEIGTRLPGVVASMKNGSHYIRWDDGFASFPFGSVRAYDEYIAAHTERRTAQCGLSHFETGADQMTAESQSYFNVEHASTR